MSCSLLRQLSSQNINLAGAAKQVTEHRARAQLNAGAEGHVACVEKPVGHAGGHGLVIPSEQARPAVFAEEIVFGQGVAALTGARGRRERKQGFSRGAPATATSCYQILSRNAMSIVQGL